MESISPSAETSASKVIRATEQPVSRSKGEPKPEEVNSTNLMNFNGLAERVQSSGSTIRPEAVERGKALISDPNWLNDTIIDALSKKILDEEDFTS
jgi:hypothetical protein